MPGTRDFAEVYRDYWSGAASVALQLTRDHAAAEDIAAAALARVWPHWEAGRVSQPWGYIRKTVVNETINRARKAARERTAMTEYWPPEERCQEELLVDLDEVERLLAELPPRQRDVLQLRFLQDLTEREVALRLGISVGTVKSTASRALARLRRSTAGSWAFGPGPVSGRGVAPRV
jgi:RNA polymerase sigma factor (sigma-70 family)